MLLREFSTLAGVAFQIRDDLLDVAGDKGRPTGSDVREGKRTILAVHAGLHASPKNRAKLFAILDKPRTRTSIRDVRWVLDLYRDLDAPGYAHTVERRLLDQAAQHLYRLPESKAKYRLLRLCKYLGTRSR